MTTPDITAPNSTISDSDGPAAPAESSPPADAAAVDPGAAAPLPGDTGSCDANPVQELVGRVADDSVLEQARTTANADTARILHPGQAVTMEYNGARLNLQVDDDGVIQAVRCG
ncbi:Elastase inhibitor AFLEI Flags: Precursor [Coralloluteibacterium stylophorae]|uniref:Elastase inhibitor AFLEI Flags n=2 Tax=Coralloluteibacterium stylophorae TaxID=1776034 RepID=A0A8J8AYS5_9GAMM|nr:Elastase inhibitor AFLEI Flags: Precursor [Coralloluteibacterium stylophorae]